MADAIEGRAIADERLDGHGVEMLDDLTGHQAENGLFTLEMIEKGRRCDIRSLSDFVDGRFVEALLGEKFAGCGVDPRSDFELASLAAAERGGGIVGVCEGEGGVVMGRSVLSRSGPGVTWMILLE